MILDKQIMIEENSTISKIDITDIHGYIVYRYVKI